MADVSAHGGGGSSGGGGVRWQDEADPELRPLVVKRLEATMAGLCRALHKDRSLPEGLNQSVANFEELIFERAKDIIDYMKMISIRVSHGHKVVRHKEVQLKTAERQQKMQMVHQMQLPNIVQASPSWPPFQSPNQLTACSVVSNMNSNVNQGPSDIMAMLYQNFNSEPATVAPVAPGVQSIQQIMQSTIAVQTESKSPSMKLQPTNIAQYHPANTVQLQGQQIARPNGHQNHLLERNVSNCVQHLLPTQQQEHFWITQQQVGMHMQRSQMPGANVGKINTGNSCGWNNQQNAGWASGIQSPSKVCGQTNMDSHPISPAQSQITVNQESNLHCTLPPHESRSQTRQNIVTTLAGQKTHSNQSQGVTSPCFSHKSPGALQSSLTNNVELCCTPSPISKFWIASPDQLTNDVELCCTPSPSSKFWITSPSELPKSRSQSPIAKQGLVAAVSPCVSVKSALTSAEKTGFEAAASPSTFVKSVSPSAIVNSGIVPAALPSDSDSSSLLHNNAAVSGFGQMTTTELSTPVLPADQAGDQEHGQAETPVAKSPKTPAPPTDQAEDQEHGGAETRVAKTPAQPADQAEDQEHGRAEALVTKTPAPPSHQAKDQEHGGAETPVAKKPIDRLIAAVLSSSPAMVRSSFNLMKSAIIDMDSVPLPIEPNNKMKRVYAVTSTSESPTLSSTDDSTVTIEFNASDAASSEYHSGKRQKPQNAKDALLDEIEAVNSRLIDTVISIASEDGADGMTLIKLSYTAVSLGPGLKSKFGVSGNFQPLLMPTTLSIPADYPRSSPVIVDDEGGARMRNKFSSISVAVDRAFRLALHNLQEPRSLKEIASVWDSCARRAVTEYVYQLDVVDTNSSFCLSQGWVKV